MVRFVAVSMVTIGAVRSLAQIQATSSSLAAVLSQSVTTELWVFPFVVSKIDFTNRKPMLLKKNNFKKGNKEAVVTYKF
jgi:hypothetical protein